VIAGAGQPPVRVRVAGHVKQAHPGEVLVSSTVKDLVAGSGLRFNERGTANLKGLPGEWRLFAVIPDSPSHSGNWEADGTLA